MLRTIHTTLRACVLFAALGLAAAHALPRQAGPLEARPASPPALRTLAEGISKDEAVEIVRARYPGRVISAKAEKRDGRRVYVVKVLSDEGRVRTVTVDAESGRIQ